MKLIACTLLLYLASVSSQQKLFKKDNFYAFEKADNKLDKPPRVRKPPYIPSDLECPGLSDKPTHYSAKNTLCGDLNSGFIPKNPLGQNVHGQPYPFELIKNKTLHFLANSLPVLKQRMHTIPKVAKIAKSFNFDEQRFSRQVSNDSMVIENRHKPVAKNGTDLFRQNPCDGNSICQAIDALRQDGPFSKTFLTNLVSAVSNTGAIGNMASMLSDMSSNNNNDDKKNGNKSTISQVLSTLSTISDANNYNPLVSIIDYISTFQNSKFPSRRRKPFEAEDLLPEQPTEQSGTPCQSVDEYISPTYARNYQGIWKYVVQIPSEGYFTQTIQRTGCLKNKCEYMDGMCLESPRWVSLLVAEVFYPDVYFPVGGEQTLNYKQNNMIPNTNNNQIISIKNNHKLRPKPPSLPVNYPVFPEDLKRIDMVESQPQRDQITPRTSKKVSGKPQIQELNIPEEILSKISKPQNKECDGFDKIGCYVIRVYYDWFLVNGSCKCWKTSKQSGGINEAIKRIFIGKW